MVILNGEFNLGLLEGRKLPCPSFNRKLGTHHADINRPPLSWDVQFLGKKRGSPPVSIVVEVHSVIGQAIPDRWNKF